MIAPIACLVAVAPCPDMCLHVTSYNVWDANGDIYPGYNGQCDEDCSLTGGLYTLPDRVEDYKGGYAACIHGWTAIVGQATTHIEIDVEWGNAGWYGIYACVDTFGRESYRKPFYHPVYWRWVTPVDILSTVPIHELVCNYHTYRDYAIDEYAGERKEG